MSITSIFKIVITGYDINMFSKNNYWVAFVFLPFLVFFSKKVLINLLIATLVESYSNVTKEADSRHRATLIGYWNRWKWDDQYGYLIFMPPPFNMISLIFLPVMLFINKSLMIKLNFLICRIMFVLLYGLTKCHIFLIYNLA